MSDYDLVMVGILGVVTLLSLILYVRAHIRYKKLMGRVEDEEFLHDDRVEEFIMHYSGVLKKEKEGKES